MERKLLKIALVVASSLLLSFSAFADDGEASDLPIEEVTHDIELVNDSSLEASEISNNNLSEILGGPLRSPSLNPNTEFNFIGFSTIADTNGFRVSVNFEGNIPDPYDLFYVHYSGAGKFAQSPNYITNVIPYNSTIDYIRLGNQATTSGDLVWSGTVTVTEENVGSDSAGSGSQDIGIVSYLSFVGSVFTWLLTTIGTLITFIMGNPFLAVSLFLFLAGTVISFFIRIKNA